MKDVVAIYCYCNLIISAYANKKSRYRAAYDNGYKVFVSFVFSCFYKPLLCELELFMIAKVF